MADTTGILCTTHGRTSYCGLFGLAFPRTALLLRVWLGRAYLRMGESIILQSVDHTEMAKEGKLDPTIGRDEEIRRTIQILSRRTKSNPVLIGPPGVGKTAILDGLASRIVAKEVPESLQNKRVLSIDPSAIMAGSGIRGQFEEKFKALIRDIEDEAGNVICFIGEVHALFQLGKAEGSIDAGQMIKPAPARGLQLVGATTPDEYRKTIGKDAALERRFQPVSIDEPTAESTISILRGLKPRYEVHHGVEISDSALVTAAVYSSRYISDRYLPDKAIDLVDEAASALRLAQESNPDELESLDREIMTLQIELESLKNESDVFSVERREKVESDLKRKKDEAQHLTDWTKIKNLKEQLEETEYQLEVAQRQGQYELASRLRFATIPELKAQLPKEDSEGAEVEGEGPLSMLHDRMNPNDIARVVAKATGIPVQNLLKGEKDKLVRMEDTLRQRVVGQDHVVTAISDAVRMSRAGLQALNRPVASFLFLGPTGVGKTELCKALVGFLFNDEQRGLININMSEHHDRHIISRPIGQLTEAVRRKPYAVILLDELEKAHKDVAMILLRILDEGSITDSQGRKVDFKNTIICLTSNLGSDILAHKSTCNENGVVLPDARDEVLQRTQEYFPPELLNRLDSMLVFNKLSKQSILQVVSLRLNDVAARLKSKRITLDVDESAREWLATPRISGCDVVPMRCFYFDPTYISSVERNTTLQQMFAQREIRAAGSQTGNGSIYPDVYYRYEFKVKSKHIFVKTLLFFASFLATDTLRVAQSIPV
ncbi:P-loop containing nucleoside triphosphate hydrolase protein [Lentinula aff. lateritia]|uniref:P-loop containing nucleoside triphosphate hydrolase protein n=1 Tax=Lentinula aff. lateritia TaxID=2804960 RepID=A0ACC1UEY2_9AGAR|nr:P-loop containing nucleoside triphosphate hydrolase protein [Lentinula aff. lateritia]